ncbi:DNA-deoxyinosine glycosylase [Undibacterium terreum]|uniref:DNA-deoxyinosine glycosylase n=1 Tax=Undibacterium terreum TaxID=1224302 RepID=A0A916UKU3_9BURK|nr:DNA-deoxyinosine glycosylase [Undibacterium terreum]GGC75949.1 DNA-deoxyinosine glycosylase [Undibacterium terreum]
MTQLEEAPRLQGFPAVIDKNTTTLILGSFPGEASLQEQQYYAHPRNQFWRLLSAVLNVDLVVLPYPQRLAGIKAHGIGLWDIFDSCLRQGSLDSAIRQQQINDFSALQQQYPKLHKLCFNGKTAGKVQGHFDKAGYQTLVLPSSSPANAQMSFEQKLLLWQAIL